MRASIFLLLIGCGGGEAKPDKAGTYPLDDVLSVAQLQAEGTHNSYHIAIEGGIPQFAYSHAPLSEQLAEQGVRQFELDVNYVDGVFEVFHAALIDDRSTCPLLSDCLAQIRHFTDANPGHHPLMVHIEPKDPVSALDLDVYYDDLEDALASGIGADRIVDPGEVGANGWPTLGESRGKVIFVLLDGGDHRDFYAERGGTLFLEGNPGDGAMVARRDDPYNVDSIREALDAGMLVRTRADTDGEEARNGDYSRFEAALASGAQFISTDFPAPTDLDYFIEIPDGHPSRCNPITAPEECENLAIEDPALL